MSPSSLNFARNFCNNIRIFLLSIELLYQDFIRNFSKGFKKKVSLSFLLSMPTAIHFWFHQEFHQQFLELHQKFDQELLLDFYQGFFISSRKFIRSLQKFQECLLKFRQVFPQNINLFMKSSKNSINISFKVQGYRTSAIPLRKMYQKYI